MPNVEETLFKRCSQRRFAWNAEKNPCYKCAYNRHAPCIGFCYQQMTAHPVDPNEKI